MPRTTSALAPSTLCEHDAVLQAGIEVHEHRHVGLAACVRRARGRGSGRLPAHPIGHEARHPAPASRRGGARYVDVMLAFGLGVRPSTRPCMRRHAGSLRPAPGRTPSVVEPGVPIETDGNARAARVWRVRLGIVRVGLRLLVTDSVGPRTGPGAAPSSQENAADELGDRLHRLDASGPACPSAKGCCPTSSARRRSTIPRSTR